MSFNILLAIVIFLIGYVCGRYHGYKVYEDWIMSLTKTNERLERWIKRLRRDHD